MTMIPSKNERARTSDAVLLDNVMQSDFQGLQLLRLLLICTQACNVLWASMSVNSVDVLSS